MCPGASHHFFPTSIDCFNLLSALTLNDVGQMERTKDVRAIHTSATVCVIVSNKLQRPKKSLKISTGMLSQWVTRSRGWTPQANVLFTSTDATNICTLAESRRNVRSVHSTVSLGDHVFAYIFGRIQSGKAGHYRQVAVGTVTSLDRMHYKCMCQLIAYSFCAFHCL